ncbi:RsmG family class I SAM-dependent methyltransferase [Alphaproteobacteria bacterium endosymbiont of Tiliacea citrago]|uniref:RsmG family class I SAM-dependent methyltransferase n=1 Tax=Alphaproteobacteria bacterium endosymbiont of Tiliacea citrago TaxID=3077944 RepID=UPI00313DBD01
MLKDSKIEKLTESLVTKIDSFGELIKEWNKFSLVANSTLTDLWGWHFNEAFSIIPLLKEIFLDNNSKIYDFGAGGGVIGYPLFLYGFNDVYLIERSSNKLFFFRNVLKYINTLDHVNDYENSIVIVRGVTKILHLLKQLKNAKYLILFKSLSVREEIKEALNFWSFEFDLFDRVGNAKGYIVLIYNIKKA